MNMKTMHSHSMKWPIICGLPAFCLYGVLTPAQTAPKTPSQSGGNSEAVQGSDITRRELANFDEFLDAHREIAEQVRKDPSLLDNKQFLKDHPVLQTYLRNHPGVREEVKENPAVFMHAENRYEHAEDAAFRQKLASFDRFLDKHREIAEQVRKNPSLLDNQQYLKDHPELQAYLQDHTGVRNAVRENAAAFMQQENRFERTESETGRGDSDAARRDSDRDRGDFDAARRDSDRDRGDSDAARRDNDRDRSDSDMARRDSDRDRGDSNADRRDSSNRPVQDRDRDITRRELANFDGFLDSHREIAEQVRKDASLLDNKQFLKEHPVLQTYLYNHPGVREEVQENPSAFMHAENRFDRTEDAAARGKLVSFDQFLDKHQEIAEQVRKNPSLLDNQQFLKDHPELQAYLKDHPGVSNEARNNPSVLMRQEERFDQREADAFRRDPDAGHRQFGEFLGEHREISRDLSKDASLVKRDEYVHNHLELQAFLNSHPEVQEQLMADPQGFLKSSQQFTAKTPSTVKTTTPPTTAEKPKP